jgi:hypothetical protein
VEQKPSAIELFQSSLEDATVLIERLLPYYTSAKELIEVLQLAQTNETQLKVLFGLVTSKK